MMECIYVLLIWSLEKMSYLFMMNSNVTQNFTWL